MFGRGPRLPCENCDFGLQPRVRRVHTMPDDLLLGRGRAGAALGQPSDRNYRADYFLGYWLPLRVVDDRPVDLKKPDDRPATGPSGLKKHMSVEMEIWLARCSLAKPSTRDHRLLGREVDGPPVLPQPGPVASRSSGFLRSTGLSPTTRNGNQYPRK